MPGLVPGIGLCDDALSPSPPARLIVLFW